MDASRFDRLARLFASAATRRATLTSLLTAPFALAITSADAAPRKRRKSKKNKNKKKRSRRGNLARAGTPSTLAVPGARGTAGSSGGKTAAASVAACSRTWRVCSAELVLAGADLRGCDFTRERLAGLDVSGALLDGASLRGANLEGAILDGAILTNACLADAILRDASLRGATLADADLTGANLAGADLRGTDLTHAQLASVDFLCNTHLPNGTISNRDLGTERACATCDKGCMGQDTCCNGTCVDLAKDLKHCGACGNNCPAAPRSASVFCDTLPDVTGQLVTGCYYACDKGWHDCDDIFENGCETPVDAANCADCGHTCEAGLECCDCRCVTPGTKDCGFCPEIRNAKLIRRP
jgi:hypothetical protein